MKQKHRFRPYTCSIQRQQRVDFWSFFPASQLTSTAIFGGSFYNNNSFIEFCNRSNNDCWIYKHSISITSE